MRNEKWIKHICTLVALLFFGLLAAGSKTETDETLDKTYSSYSTYYQARAIDLDNRQVEPGTPVYLYVKSVWYNGGTRELVILTDESGRLHGKYVIYDHFNNALNECDGSHSPALIYGVITKSKKLRILRIEANGRSWTEK